MSTKNRAAFENQAVSTAAADSQRRSLYRVGGAALLGTLGFYLTEVIVFAVAGRPFPSTTQEWFMLFQESRLLGLFYLNALDMVSIALMGPMFLALYMALRRVDDTWMLVATCFAFIGIPVFIAPRAATLAILPLSERFAAAITEVQRASLLAVGDAVGALAQPTSQTVGFIFIAVAVLIIGLVMRRSSAFGRATAYFGVLAGGLTMISFVCLIVTPAIADALVVIGMLPWLIWWVLVARRLLQLGRLESEVLPQQA